MKAGANLAVFILALGVLSGGCATLSKGDIKRTGEARSVIDEAQQQTADRLDRSTRTTGEVVAMVRKAESEGRAEEARARAEEARALKELEEARVRSAERIAAIKQETARVEQETARLENGNGNPNAVVLEDGCYADRVAEAKVEPYDAVTYARLELDNTGWVKTQFWTRMNQESFGGTDVKVCPKNQRRGKIFHEGYWGNYKKI